MKTKSLTLIFMLSMSIVLSSLGIVRAETDKNKTFHTIHELINHGLNMVMDGSTLIMMNELGLDPTMAETSVEHGQAMIDEGKALIDKAIRGPVMVDMHVKEMGKSKMMEETHHLGELILKAVYSQNIMHPQSEDSVISKKLFIMNVEANHALMMASQGSNMVMIGQDSTDNDLSRFSIKHGQTMMLRARAILQDLLFSPLMKDLEKMDLTPEDQKVFQYTKDRLVTSVDIANILVRMEFE